MLERVEVLSSYATVSMVMVSISLSYLLLLFKDFFCTRMNYTMPIIDTSVSSNCQRHMKHIVCSSFDVSWKLKWLIKVMQIAYPDGRLKNSHGVIESSSAALTARTCTKKPTIQIVRIHLLHFCPPEPYANNGTTAKKDLFISIGRRLPAT